MYHYKTPVSHDYSLAFILTITMCVNYNSRLVYYNHRLVTVVSHYPSVDDVNGIIWPNKLSIKEPWYRSKAETSQPGICAFKRQILTCICQCD